MRLGAAVDPAALARRGSAKGSVHPPDVLPAWVAEVDFPLAPAVEAALLDAVQRDDTGYFGPRSDRLARRRRDQELAGSRAGGLHARTIEVLDQRGIADRFLAEGQALQVQRFVVPLDISDFPTRHP